MKAMLKVGLLLLVGFIFAVVFLPNSSIAWSLERLIERRHIYSTAHDRIAAAGGWEKVEQACLNYATNGFDSNEHGIYYLHGRRFDTNSLPQTIELLQPMFFEITKDQNGIPIFQVILSCGHRTGTYDAPYYAIWIVETNRSNYLPVFGTSFRGAQGLVERKGDLIFEAR